MPAPEIDWKKIGADSIAGWFRLFVYVVGISLIAVGVGWCHGKYEQAANEGILWMDCPFRTELAGAHPPDGREEWCQKKVEGAYVRHGSWQAWYRSGQLKAKGRYENGRLVEYECCGKWRPRKGLAIVPTAGARGSSAPQCAVDTSNETLVPNEEANESPQTF